MSKMKYRNTIIIVCLLVIFAIGIFVKNRYGLNTKTMLIVGDSIGEGAGSSDPAFKWYKKLAPYMKENYGIDLEITNVSMGGNTSYAGYVRTMNLDEKTEYDYVVVCYGQNDSVENFSLYYETLLRTIKEKYPSAVVISILESSQREYTEKIQIIQELCKHYGVYIADTIAAFNSSGYTYEELCDDGTHPNDNGYKLYFDTVVEVLNQCYDDFGDNEVENIEPINSNVKQFERYIYYSKNDLKQIGDLTYELGLEETSGRLGIDYVTVEGEHWIKIKSSHETQYERQVVWEHMFSLRYIEVITDDFSNNGRIVLEFSSKEMFENFNGIVVTGF